MTGGRLVRGRGRGRLAALIAVVLLVVAACATATSPGSSPSRTIRPSDLSSASTEPASPVVGTVASVDPPAAPSASPGKATAKPSKSPKPTASPTAREVVGFTLLTTGGETLTFVIGELDNADDFPPSDLYDRLTTEDPIRVYFTVDGPNLIVHHIEDAG